jgi:hypothetical protein
MASPVKPNIELRNKVKILRCLLQFISPLNLEQSSSPIHYKKEQLPAEFFVAISNTATIQASVPQDLGAESSFELGNPSPGSCQADSGAGPATGPAIAASHGAGPGELTGTQPLCRLIGRLITGTVAVPADSGGFVPGAVH